MMDDAMKENVDDVDGFLLRIYDSTASLIQPGRPLPVGVLRSTHVQPMFNLKSDVSGSPMVFKYNSTICGRCWMTEGHVYDVSECCCRID